MGEIKSTLELALERTRHLTLDPEQRKQQHQEQFTQQVSGWINRHLDEACSDSELQQAIADLFSQAEQQGLKPLPLAIGRLRPHRRAASFLDACAKAAGMDLAKLHQRLTSYWDTVEQRRQQAIQQALQQLEQDVSIAGDAITINLERNAHWQEQQQVLWQQCRQDLVSLAESVGAEKGRPQSQE